VHVESDFLRDVAEPEKVLRLVSAANRMTTLSSVVFNSELGRMSLHASVCVSDQNIERAVRAAHIIASLQAADASAKCTGFAQLLGASPDTSGHPERGTREEGDAVLATLQVMAELNQQPSVPANELDLKPLEGLEPRPWVLAFAGTGGMTAEFPFTNEAPAIFAAASGQPPGTALLRLSTDEDHPQLGDGVLVRLSLPITGTVELAMALNEAESHEGADNADQVGGWCETDGTVEFVTFLPSCLLDWELLTSVIYDNAIRTQWVRKVLLKDGDE
jgi:hypothetical protein